MSTPFDYLVGKWMLDELYNKSNNTIPLWAKNVWDCRLLIVNTASYKMHPDDPRRELSEDPDRLIYSLGVLYGFKIKKYLHNGIVVASDLRDTDVGWINDFSVEDDKIYAYGNLRGTLLKETHPDMEFVRGQEIMF